MSDSSKPLAQQLADAKERFRVIAEGSLTGIYLIQDGKFAYVNPAMARMFGCDVDEIVGKVGPLEMAHPDDRALVAANIERRLTGELDELKYEFRALRKDRTPFYVEVHGHRTTYGGKSAVIGSLVDISERKRADEERQAHLWFFESMDKVNRAMQSSHDLPQTMRQVLDAVLAVFGCDRAWLQTPCDPAASTWSVAMERTRTDIPAAFKLMAPTPMTPPVAAVCRAINSASDPVVFGGDAGPELPADLAGPTGARSMLAMPLRPKLEHPYLFGLQQCSFARTWTAREIAVFHEIGRRLTESLTSLLAYRDLRRSERKLELAQRISHLGYWDRDYVAGEVTFSDEVYRILGVPVTHRVMNLAEWEKQWEQLIHPDDRQRTTEAAKTALHGGAPYDIEYRVVRRDGTIRVVHSRGDVTRDDAGRPRRMFGVIQDITDQRTTQDALRRSQEHLTAIFQSVDGIVWEADPETFHFKFVSPRAERLLGYRLSKWTEEPTFWADHIHPEDRAMAVEYCRRSVRELRGHEFEYRMLAADGRAVWLRDIVTVVAEQGRPTAIRGVMVDITNQKLAEYRIQQLNRTYAVLSEINQLIVRERVRDQLCQGACEIAVEKGGFLLAWIGLIDPAEARLSIIADRGITPDTRRVLEDIFSPNGCGCDITAAALSTGRFSVCNDIAGHVPPAGWQPEALKRGYRSMVTLPLKFADRVVGVFNLYAKEVGFFDDEEIRLLDELAQDIAFALEGCERERERQEALGRLRASEERFRELAETIDDVFWITDVAKTRILYISPRYEQVWGRTCESIYAAPTSWTDALHPDDRERVLRGLPQQPKGGYDEEYRILRPTGEVRWIRDQAFPVRGASGEVERIVGVARDITERKAAQAELHHREEHFRLLIENAADLITVVNNAGLIRFQSPASESVLGYRPQEMIGRNALDLVHPDDLAQVTAALERAIASPAVPVRVEFRLRHHEGDWRMLQSVGRSIPGQAPDGFVVLNSRDVTESRRLEEQLRHAQKMEAIGQLAGGVAHDFNNILAAIRMQTDLTEMTAALPPEAIEGLQQIRNAAERAANLTRQLLLFGRRQVMQMRELDVNEVVTSLASMLQRIIGEDVRLQLHLYPAPLWTRGDAGMIDQVLMNLAVNARDAMPEGGRLLIETSEMNVDDDLAHIYPDATPGRYVCLRVSDTGAGIPPDVLPRIFEPFFTTKESGKGTGLGLATVFGIVKQHQGWLRVESQPGQGAKFEIFLPSNRVEAKRVAPPAAQPKPKGGSETILIAEDDVAVRVVTRAILQKYGYSVLEAASGPEAMTVWMDHRQEIVLLITDLVMPGGMNGHELARRLQTERPNLRVVYTSGYSADVAGRELELRPGDSFIQKPFAPEQLLEAVRRAIDIST